MSVILNYLPKQRQLLHYTNKKIFNASTTVLSKSLSSFSPTYTNVVKPKRNIAKRLISKLSTFVKKPKEKIKQLTTSSEISIKNNKSSGKTWARLNPKNWFNKTNKKPLSSFEPIQTKTGTGFFNNIKRRFKIFKHGIKKSKPKTFDLQKQNLSSRIKAFFSTGKKKFVNNATKIFNPIKAYTSNFINKPKTIETIAHKSSPETKQTLWTKTKPWVEKQKTRIQKLCQTKTGPNSKKFTSKNPDGKKIQNKNINPELEEKIQTRIRVFKNKRVNVKKATKKIDNLYNTIIKDPDRLTGKSYENNMISLCDSIGHSFDTLKRNPNYVDSLIKVYGNMKHLTCTLSPEEIRMVSKLEQVFKKFKEIQFPNQQKVRG